MKLIVQLASDVSHTATGNSNAIYGITQCYLPPDRGENSAFTPAEADVAGTEM